MNHNKNILVTTWLLSDGVKNSPSSLLLWKLWHSTHSNIERVGRPFGKLTSWSAKRQLVKHLVSPLRKYSASSPWRVWRPESRTITTGWANMSGNTTVYHLQRREGTITQPNVCVFLEHDVNSHSEGRQTGKGTKTNGPGRTDSYCAGLKCVSRFSQHFGWLARSPLFTEHMSNRVSW